MEECPVCNKSGIPVWQKWILNYKFPARCRSCDNKIGLHVPWWIGLMGLPFLIVISFDSINKSPTFITLSLIIYILFTLVLNGILGRLVKFSDNENEKKVFNPIGFFVGSTVFFILLSLPAKFDYGGVKGLSAVIAGSLIVGCFLGLTIGSDFKRKKATNIRSQNSDQL